MNKIDIAKATYSFDDFEESAKHLSDDFQGTDSVGGPPFDKAGWLGMGQMFKGSIPDIKVIVDEVHEEGDSVMLTSHFSGTFTNDLDLSAMGMGVIPASGKEIVWPEMSVKYMVEGEKIVREIPYGDVSGIEDFLAPLGVEPASG